MANIDEEGGNIKEEFESLKTDMLKELKEIKTSIKDSSLSSAELLNEMKKIN
jgi:hypothetical protein